MILYQGSILAPEWNPDLLWFFSQILTSGLTPEHSDYAKNREEALETTLAEWYLFTQCHFFLFHESAMSKSAAMYALRPNSMFQFGRNRLTGTCDPSLPTKPLILGTTWSGI